MYHFSFATIIVIMVHAIEQTNGMNNVLFFVSLESIPVSLLQLATSSLVVHHNCRVSGYMWLEAYIHCMCTIEQEIIVL